jgi:hypothetical protein
MTVHQFFCAQTGNGGVLLAREQPQAVMNITAAFHLDIALGDDGVVSRGDPIA